MRPSRLRLVLITLVVSAWACAKGSAEETTNEDDGSGAGGGATSTTAAAGGTANTGAAGPNTTSTTTAGGGELGGAGGFGGDGGSGGFGGFGGAGGAGGCATFSLTNLGLAIPDDAYDGSLGSMACASIVVPSMMPDNVAEVTVEVGIEHTWLGDVTVKLQSPTLTVVTLVSRAGTVEAADDGLGVTGDSSNLAAAFPLLYADGSANSAEDMGGVLGTSDSPCLSDGICTYDPNAGAASPGKLSTFVGQAIGGTWKLCAADSGYLDQGTLWSVALHVCK